MYVQLLIFYENYMFLSKQLVADLVAAYMYICRVLNNVERSDLVFNKLGDKCLHLYNYYLVLKVAV